MNFAASTFLLVSFIVIPVIAAQKLETQEKISPPVTLQPFNVRASIEGIGVNLQVFATGKPPRAKRIVAKEIVPNSLAEKAGLRRGQFWLAVNGTPLEGLLEHELAQVLTLKKTTAAQAELRITVRALFGKSQVITVNVPTRIASSAPTGIYSDEPPPSPRPDVALESQDGKWGGREHQAHGRSLRLVISSFVAYRLQANDNVQLVRTTETPADADFSDYVWQIPYQPSAGVYSRQVPWQRAGHMELIPKLTDELIAHYKQLAKPKQDRLK